MTRNALAVREAIEAVHPEISITTPLTSRSGKWELVIDDSTAQWDDFWLMIDHLADRFGDIDSGGEGRYVEYGLDGRAQPPAT
jgi:hypothetical protein